MYKNLSKYWTVGHEDPDVARRASALALLTLAGMISSAILLMAGAWRAPDPVFVVKVQVPILTLLVTTYVLARRGRAVAGSLLLCVGGPVVLSAVIATHEVLNVQIFFLLLWSVFGCAVLRSKDVKWLLAGYLFCVGMLAWSVGGYETPPLSADRILVPLTAFCLVASVSVYVATRNAEHALEDQRLAAAAHQRAELHASRFLANMSHELRTPLNTIIGYAELLEEELGEELEPHSRQDLDVIAQASGQLLGMVEQVLDLSSLDARVYKVETFDARDIARDVARSLRRVLETRGHELTLALQPEPMLLESSPERVHQALSHVLDNAARFTPEGGSVTLSVRTEGPDVCWEVVDTGPGIAREVHEEIFAPFRQLDPSSTRERDGAGLGLTMARSIMDALGGRIELQSALGQGATFRLLLPRTQLSTT